jgi:hypothetical protein
MLTITWDVNGVALFLKKGANGNKVKIWKDSEKNTEITRNSIEWHRQQITHEVDPKDGKTGLHVFTDRLGQGIELRGRVNPSDFAQKLIRRTSEADLRIRRSSKRKYLFR